MEFDSVFKYILLGGSDGEESACNARDPGSSPGLGRSPGEGSFISSTGSLMYFWTHTEQSNTYLGKWQEAPENKWLGVSRDRNPN